MTSFSPTVNGMVNDTTMFNVPSGKIYHIDVHTQILLSLLLPTMTVPLQYDMKTCDVSGHGKVWYVTAGWVWFQYNNKVSCPQHIS